MQSLMKRYKVEEIFAIEGQKWPDLTLFGHCHTRGTESTYVSDVHAFYCTHAYGLTRKAASILIKHLDHFQFAPVDIAMRHFIQAKEFKVKGLFPPIVRQLPRSYLADKSVSGSNELPIQILQDPVLQSNAVYESYIRPNNN